LANAAADDIPKMLAPMIKETSIFIVNASGFGNGCLFELRSLSFNVNRSWRTSIATQRKALCIIYLHLRSLICPSRIW
jgi:hypothetical protein